jgi:hypothetical protein
LAQSSITADWNVWGDVLIAVELRIQELVSFNLDPGSISDLRLSQLNNLNDFADELRMKLGYVESNHLGN